VQPFLQSPAREGVYDMKTYFTLAADIRYIVNKHWRRTLKGENLTNSHLTVHSEEGNQNYTMTFNRKWRSAILNIVYTFGNYKEKPHKAPDTSRMGQN